MTLMDIPEFNSTNYLTPTEFEVITGQNEDLTELQELKEKLAEEIQGITTSDVLTFTLQAGFTTGIIILLAIVTIGADAVDFPIHRRARCP